MRQLRWSNHPDLFALPTAGDGSCALHAVVQAFHPSYQAGRNVDGSPVNRHAFVRAFRDELAEMLSKPSEGNSGPTWYERLSRGTLTEFAKATKGVEEVPDLSMNGFIAHLRSSEWLGQEIIEYVGSVLQIAIFILLEDRNGETRGLYSLGKDSDTYYKGTKAVIIVSHANDHFSTVGRRESDGGIRTFFDMDDPLIKEFLVELADSS